MRCNSGTIVIGILLAGVSLANSDAYMKFLKCGVDVHDSDIMKNITCLARPVNRTTTVINLNGFLARKMFDMLLNIQLYKKTEVTYRPFMVNITQNYCEYLKTGRCSTYFRLLMDLYMPYTNMNHTCPYFGPTIIRELPIRPNPFVSVWPIGVFRWDILVMESKHKVVTVQIFVEVIERFNPSLG